MSKNEIFKHLAKLSAKERQEVRKKLDELDGVADDGWDDDELTDAQKRMIEQRIANAEKHPAPGSSWPEVEARIRSRLKK